MYPAASGGHSAPRRLRWAAGLGLLLAGLAVLPAVRAADNHPAAPKPPAAVRVEEKLTIGPTGDGRLVTEIRLPETEYRQLKDLKPTAAFVLRKYGVAEPAYAEVADVKNSWDDKALTLTVSRTVKGVARVGRSGEWEATVPAAVRPVLTEDPNALVFLERHGAVTHVSRVFLPADSCSGRLTEPSRLTYTMPPQDARGSSPQATVRLEAAPAVMSCLAKAHANPNLADLWVARAVFENTGDQTLTDYRVRFRVPGFAPEWSAWQSCPQVVPGQTVVDPFFPLFDLDRMARLEANTPAAVEVQVQYRRGDGVLVEETAEKRFTILGRGQILRFNYQEEDLRTMGDYNLLRYALAAFVTYNDPVILETAGRLCQKVGGAAAADSDADALKFARALYEFMADNLAYQTPPGEQVNGQHSQNVKYGRDVLRNHAGTCVDLAIFYATVCEAVGLETELEVVKTEQGYHCFPVVKLPGGKVLPVETTLIGQGDFDKARKVGEDDVARVRSGDWAVLPVRARDWHARGVWGPELPELPANVLDSWHVRFAEKVK